MPGATGIIVTPYWMFASNVSRRDGRQTFSWCGCKHAMPMCDQGFKTREEMPAVEKRWDHIAELIFETHTARWSDASRARFRRRLGMDGPQSTAAELILGDDEKPK